MPARVVIHVAGPVHREGQDNERLLRTAVSTALDAARSASCRTVALPAVSAGVYGYPLGEATAVIASEVQTWVAGNPGELDEVILVGYDGAAAGAFREALA